MSFARGVHKYLSHRSRGSPIEISSTPLSYARIIDELQIRLVHQLGCLNALISLLPAELSVGDGAQLLVDERNELIHRSRFSGFECVEQMGRMVTDRSLGRHLGLTSCLLRIRGNRDCRYSNKATIAPNLAVFRMTLTGTTTNHSRNGEMSCNTRSNLFCWQCWSPPVTRDRRSLPSPTRWSQRLRKQGDSSVSSHRCSRSTAAPSRLLTSAGSPTTRMIGQRSCFTAIPHACRPTST